MICIPFKKFQLCEGDFVKVQIGIRLFVGQIMEIDEFNNVVLKDVVGNDVVFKPKNAKFIQKISQEEFNRVKQRYTGGSQ